MKYCTYGFYCLPRSTYTLLETYYKLMYHGYLTNTVDYNLLAELIHNGYLTNSIDFCLLAKLMYRGYLTNDAIIAYWRNLCIVVI